MANFDFSTITLPTPKMQKLSAALKAELGNEDNALTEQEIGDLWLHRALKSVYRRYRVQRETAGLTANAQRALDTANSASKVARRALDTAQATISADVDQDFPNA